jgi:thiamine-phosphate pyrophosphorylase
VGKRLPAVTHAVHNETRGIVRSTLERMAERRPLLYYITDRFRLSAAQFSGAQFAGDERACLRALLNKIAEAARAGVDYIQLREKDLRTRELEQLACEAVNLVRGIRAENPELKLCLLINSRTDVALAVGADGVHLRSDDLSVSDVRLVVERTDRSRQIAGAATGTTRFLVGVSCHGAADVARAESDGADFVVFAPVFEKRHATEAVPQGLAALREACRASIPVLALGGVTLENASACLEAGAAGIAGIRLFQENKISDVVDALHSS